VARAVLALGRLCTTALALLLAPSPGLANPAQQSSPSSKPSDCSSTADPNVLALQKSTNAGPFYKELLRRYGKPISCTLEVDSGKTRLTYAFRGPAQLVMQVDPEIELSEERMQVRRMDGKKAMELLKAAEKDSYPPDGCGIAWNRPAEETPGTSPGSREAVYRGTDCNCQARVAFQNNYAVSLVVKSAC